jgi:hypothetical protein
MTMFRNDHEAALARLSALEAENARLLAENASLRAPKPPPPVVHAADEIFPSKITLVMIGLLACFTFALIAYLLVAG